MQGLAVASRLLLLSAVVEDDRPSVLRRIKVVEQVSVGSLQGLEHSVVHHPFALFLLLGKVMKEIPPVTMSSFLRCLESCPVSNDQAQIRTNSSRACFKDNCSDSFSYCFCAKIGVTAFGTYRENPTALSSLQGNPLVGHFDHQNHLQDYSFFCIQC